VASNLSRQTYQGKPALSWWQGYITNVGATVTGEDVIVDQHYRTIATLRGADGWIITLHELLIDGDHAWVTANRNIPMNLSRYGGAYNGALIDSAVQEYDIKTGRLLRSWDALDHIPPSESYATLPSNGFPWDAYHVNSIQLTGNGNFIVSMRNTWAAYMVNGSTDQIQWTLGGRHSSFKLGPSAAFQWQHDVALHPGSVVTMFDDHCCQITGGGTYVSPTGATRALTLNLNQRTRTATLARQYGHGANFAVDYMGNSQVLPTGGAFVGWGSKPNFSEYGPSGKLLLDVVLPGPDITYRARLEPWVGMPLYPPAGAARRTGGKTTVYASWNGATQVTSWKVVGLPPRGNPVSVATADRSGFETAIAVPAAQRQFRVQALDANGRVLGTSRPFGVSG
jgi:Arylsulfotransferase (ASST)